MTIKILEDAMKYPNAFYWHGKIHKHEVLAWAKEKEITLPIDLLELLSATGGGDLFESETILGVRDGVETGDDADSANTFHRNRGLNKKYWLIHVGIVFTALDLESQNYVILDENYNLIKSYHTLNEWYLETIRSEYAERYGIYKP